MCLKISQAVLPYMLLFLSNVAYCAEIDITDHIIEIMKCTTTHYQMRADPDVDFDADAHDWAWVQCEDARNSLLQAIPAQLRLEWEGKLEQVRTSMIEAIKPKDSGRPGYGLNPKEPVMIGGIDEGPRRTYDYFRRLRSSTGAQVRVRRTGFCYRFQTPNARIGDHAPLDKYELTYDGLDSPIVIFVNIYDEGEIKAVAGFTLSDGT